MPPPSNAPAQAVKTESTEAAIARAVTELRSEETLKRIVDAIKSSGTRKGEGKIEEQAKGFIEDAIRQVSDTESDAHAGLVTCPVPSIVRAVESLALWGVSPNHKTGEGYFVPKFHKGLGTNTVVPIVGVRGYERLLMRNGAKDIKGGSIREQDKFEHVGGTEEKLSFSRNLLPDPKRSNRIIGAWAMVDMNDGRRCVEVVPIIDTELRSPRMDMDTQAAFKARRKAMRAALRTYCLDLGNVRSLVEAEQQANEMGVTDPTIHNETAQTVLATAKPAVGLATAAAAASAPTLTAGTAVESATAAKESAPPLAQTAQAEQPKQPAAISESPLSEPAAPAPAPALAASTAPTASADPVPAVPSEAPEPGGIEAILPEVLDALVSDLGVKTGVKSQRPGTALGQISEKVFGTIVAWAVGKAVIPESEKPFAEAALRVQAVLGVHGGTFPGLKSRVLAHQQEAMESAAGVKV